MREQLSLAVAESSLRVSLGTREGWTGRWKPGAWPPKRPIAQPADFMEPFDGSPEGLMEAMRKLVARVKGSGIQVRGAKVRALLSSAYSRIGLSPLSPEVIKGLDAEGQELLAKAWANQVGRLDVAHYELRTKILQHGRLMLALAVHRQILSALEAVASECGLLLTSCHPAVMAPLESPPRASGRSPRNRTLVWMEQGDASRGAWFELLHIVAGQLNGHWRCWIPAGDVASLPLLEGLVQRFKISHGIEPSDPLEQLSWPVQHDAGGIRVHS